MIWDFFRALGQGRIDNVVNTANAKKAGVITKAKTGAAKQFNKAVDAPGKAVKGAVKGGKQDETSGEDNTAERLQQLELEFYKSVGIDPSAPADGAQGEAPAAAADAGAAAAEQ